MSDAFAELDPGFYWIKLLDNEPEIARWDAETREWYLTGGEEGLGEEFAQDIKIISGRLQPG